jgi:5'-nucleotidase
MRAFSRRAALAGAALVTALAVAGPATAAKPKPRVVTGQILAFNDFHGNLEAGPAGTITTAPGATPVPAGGAEYLATTIRALRARRPDATLTVAAGDLIGASPLLSALFHDEPTIDAMNEIGLQLTSVGNHEFDEGARELQRMQNGGCHPVDGCFDTNGDGKPDAFGGADFRFLAANVVSATTGQTLFPPYAVRRLAGVRVGFIGMTLKGTPDIVAAAGIQGLKFLDEADTANRYAKELRKKGVKAVVVLLHQGGAQTAPFTINGCKGLTGPIQDIVERTSKRVDLFLTAHTHQPYNCIIDGRRVTSASSFGRLVTKVDVRLDTRTGDVRSVRARNIVVRQTAADGTPVKPAADITKLIATYRTLADPLAARVVGTLAGPATKVPDDSGEHAAGNLIADSQLAATAGPAGAVAAFMNPGGVRGDAGFPAGPISYGQAFTIQPFGNTMVTLTYSGAQLYQVLAQQWCGQASPRILLPSASVHYSYSKAAATASVGKPCGTLPNPVSDLRIGGVPVSPTGTYRVTVNNFLADGGDLFSALRGGTDRTGGVVDLDALAQYLAPTASGAPLPVPALDRIDVTA